MNTNSNTYTVIYATVLVVLVAAVLAYVSTSLKDTQQRNIDIETKQSILLSVNLAQGVDKADDKATYIEKEYDKYITDSYIVNAQGDKIEGDAFKVVLKEQFDIMRQANPDVSLLKLPVFVCTMDDGRRIDILSIYGAGLWGPIWGYVSVEQDYKTVYGATFAHKGETPGLGAEISTPHFSSQYKGKELFDGNTFTPIAVVKGGAQKGSLHEVDAISGGTITSHALQNTMTSWLEYYLPYFEKQKEANKKNVVEIFTPTDTLTIQVGNEVDVVEDKENDTKEESK